LAQNVFPALAEAFDRAGEEPWVRCAVADALGMQGPSAHDAAPMLVQALFDRDAALRTHAVWALGRIGPSGHSLHSLAAMLKDEDPQVRAAAADVLGYFGAEALPYLRPVAQDRAGDLRLRAVASLADIGAAAIPDLEALAQDADPEIRAAAVAGLATARAAAERHRLHVFAWLGALAFVLACGVWLARKLRKRRAATT
ncbi:MAG: HEAT repeat domain-containing protein, partial [Planctomycetota bacterium]|nr:HEAT repeat domain-containing protein [Planctomycetota bacterium]